MIIASKMRILRLNIPVYTTPMRLQFLTFFLCLLAVSAHASTPRLLVPAPADGGFTNPVCSPHSEAIAYTTADFAVLYLWTTDLRPPLRVAQSAGVGRRFIFEPGQERLVYRQVVGALPTKPERLISTSPYLYDPAVRTANQDSLIYGPYLIDRQVWYRPSLLLPYHDYHDSLRTAGPYLDLRTGRLQVVNASSDTVFSSIVPDSYAGMEVSPDGEWIAAVKSRPRVELTLIRVADGTPQTIRRRLRSLLVGRFPLDYLRCRTGRQPSGIALLQYHFE